MVNGLRAGGGSASCRQGELAFPRRRQACTGLLLVLLALGWAAGCTGRHPESDKDLADLLDAYRAQNLQMQRAREAMRERGIEKLEVEPGDTPASSRVSARLRNAHLDLVVHRIVEESGIGLVSGSPRPLGSVSAELDHLPVVEALRTLLAPDGMTADLHGGVVELRLLPEAADDWESEGPPGETVSTEYPLTFETTQRAVDVLDALYPRDQDEVRRVEFAAIPEHNAVMLSGSRREVAQARRTLHSLDHDPGHVLIEALVVEFNVTSFLDLGSRIESGSRGPISDFFLDIADLVGDTVSFTRVADAANTTAFRAVLKLLIGEDEARVISRPYVSTVSGSRAHLEVAEDRFVVVETPGDISVDLEPVSSGVTLDLLPTLTADGSILLDLTIEQSQFQTTNGNVQQRRARNSISSSAHVGDGQTVIVGGLMLRTRSGSTTGIPGLRNVPPFNLLFGHKDESHQDRQVMIFITPYKWEPGMDAPLEATDPFELFPVHGPAATDPAHAREMVHTPGHRTSSGPS